MGRAAGDGWNATFVRLQINDFNFGQFLTRSANDNKTCPFRRWFGRAFRNRSTWDQIDVFALGEVFYYLLSDGNNVEDFERWLNGGEEPRLPKPKEYQGFGERVFSIVQT